VVVIQAQTGGIVIGVVAPVVLTVAVVVTLEAAWVAVVVMDMEEAIAQLLQTIMVAQLMVPMGGHMVMAVMLAVMGVMLALGQVLALLMVVPCMVPHMVLMGHMAVHMEVVPTVHLEAMVQEAMVGMVVVEVWVVVVVAQAADTIHMENEHRFIAAS
jgi:hypothetical protein